MPRRASYTDSDLEYLRRAVSSNVSYAEMARRIGVCVDTCKRILHKHGIVEFQGAKYVVAAPLHPSPSLWQRPCMRCGCTKPRPKFQYRCDRCHELEERPHL